MRVQAAAVTSGDSRIRGGTFAGVIDTAGAGVDDLVPGQAVGGMTA